MATFSINQGDIFKSQAQVLVNPVNCVGVMGKGLALEFKKRYPDLDREYRSDCRAGRIRPGTVVIYPAGAGRLVANLPTKDHWRQPSRMEYIILGLDGLAAHITSRKVTSVAVPAIGAGLGGLPWPPVKEAIEQILDLPGLSVEIYPPR